MNMVVFQIRFTEEIIFLNMSLYQYLCFFHSKQSMLLSMVGKLHTIASNCLIKSKKKPVCEENLVNGQTALYSLKILCRMLGLAHHKHFTEVCKHFSINLNFLPFAWKFAFKVINQKIGYDL